MAGLEVGLELGIKFTVAPSISIQDGINAVRRLFPKLKINKENCERGLACIQAYRKERKEKLGTYSTKPLHDWTSHCCDSLRMMAVTLDLTRLTGLTSRSAMEGWEV